MPRDFYGKAGRGGAATMRDAGDQEGEMHLRCGRAALLLGMLLLTTASARGRVIISLDYSLDAGGLFDSSAARTAMDRAAQVFSDRFVDSLTAITPGGTNTWSARIINPGTGALDYEPVLSG